MKEKIDRLMSFTKFGNDLNKDALSYLWHKGMENFEDIIDYASVISYAFTKYSLKRRIKELGEKGEMALTETLSQNHMRDTFCPKSDKHLTEE